MNQYGYDENHLLSDNTLRLLPDCMEKLDSFFSDYRNPVSVCLALYIYINIRGYNLKLSQILEQYLSEDFLFAFSTEPIRKGRIDFMINQVGDRLKQLGTPN